MKDYLWFIGIIVFLWIAWFLSGGPSAERVADKPFLDSPTSIQSESSNTLDYTQKIDIGNIDGAKETNVNREFFEIIPARGNAKKINITGWKLKNSVGKEVEIGKGVIVNYSGRLNTQEPIEVGAGERIIITTGFSPVGNSFKVNKCSGFLEQYQDFTPSLRQECPTPTEEAQKKDLGSECMTYLSALSSCHTYTNEMPYGLSSSCVNFIHEDLNYNSCVDAHKYDDDFYSGEWRIFLGEDLELWNNRGDYIRLYNSNGKLIDSVVF